MKIPPSRPAMALWAEEKMVHKVEGRQDPPGTSPPLPEWSVFTSYRFLTEYSRIAMSSGVLVLAVIQMRCLDDAF